MRFEMDSQASGRLEVHWQDPGTVEGVGSGYV